MPTKTPSIISTILTTLVLLAVGALSMLMLIVMLNGFTGSSARPALITSLFCNIFGIILAAILAWLGPKWLIAKFNWNNILAVVVSIIVGLLFGSGLSFVSLFIGIIVADTIWNSR